MTRSCHHHLEAVRSRPGRPARGPRTGGWVHARATLAALSCSLTACSIFGLDSDDGIQYVVERFEVVERAVGQVPYPIAYLETELALVNTRSDSLHLQYGACVLELVGRVATEGDHRVWESTRSRPWPSNSMRGCPLPLLSARLGPGDTLRGAELRREVPLAEILADSLPSAPFDFSAVVRMGGGARVPLGRIHLPVSRHPIPEGAAHRDGFRYAVDVDGGTAASGGEARVTLRMTFTAPISQTLERTLSAACPVRILAFEDASERVTIPQPPPSWVWPTSCDGGESPVRLGPGGERTFEMVVPAAALAAADVPPGAYALLAVVDVDGRPLRFSAGALTIGG